jgi:hypothetical protein
MNKNIDKINELSKKFDDECEEIKTKIDYIIYNTGFYTIETLHSFLISEINEIQDDFDEKDVEGHLVCFKIKEFIETSFAKIK